MTRRGGGDEEELELRVEQGEAALRAGDSRGARRLLEDVFSRSRHPKAALLLTELFIGQGRLEEALRHLRAAIRRHPEYLVLRFRLGWVLQQAGRWTQMRSAYLEFLEREGDAAGVEPHYRFLARAALGTYGEAFEEAERLLDVWDPRVEYERLFRPWASNWLKPHTRGFYQERLVQMERMARRLPRSPWPRLYRGVLLAKLGRPRESLAVLDSLEGFPAERYAWMRFEAGQTRLLQGFYEEAVGDLEAVVRTRPGAWWARCRLAEAYLCSGKEKECFRELGAAEADLLGMREAAEVWAWRGEILLWLGRYREALEDLDRARREGATLAPCWKGGALMLLGRHKEALAELDRAIVPGTRDMEALVLRGELHRRKGRRRLAKKDLDLAVEMGGGTWAHVNRALLRAEEGDAEGMWEDLERVPEEVVARSLELMGRGSRRFEERDAVEVLENALVLARGIRRGEEYLRPLWRRP